MTGTLAPGGDDLRTSPTRQRMVKVALRALDDEGPNLFVRMMSQLKQHESYRVGSGLKACR